MYSFTAPLLGHGTGESETAVNNCVKSSKRVGRLNACATGYEREGHDLLAGRVGGAADGCTARYVAVVERAALVDGTTTQGAGAALSRISSYYLLRAAREGAIR